MTSDVPDRLNAVLDAFIRGDDGRPTTGPVPFRRRRSSQGSRALVTDARTGERSWREVALYEGLEVRDLYDALIYMGPEDEWTVAPPELDPVRDAGYLTAPERRRALRFGGVPPEA
jgi:hypothetical protein